MAARKYGFRENVSGSMPETFFYLMFTEKYNFSLVLGEHMCYINIERMFGTRTDKEHVFYGYVSDVGEKR